MSELIERVKQKSARLSNAEAAEYLGIKISTLNTWRCLGINAIPYTRAGRLIKYRVEDLDAFLESNAVSA